MEEVQLEQCAQALPSQDLSVFKDKPFKQLFQYLAIVMVYQIIFKSLSVLLQFPTFQIVSFLLSHLWGPLISLARSEDWDSLHPHGRWLYTTMGPLLLFLETGKSECSRPLCSLLLSLKLLGEIQLTYTMEVMLLNRGNEREAKIKKSETGRYS